MRKPEYQSFWNFWKQFQNLFLLADCKELTCSLLLRIGMLTSMLSIQRNDQFCVCKIDNAKFEWFIEAVDEEQPWYIEPQCISPSNPGMWWLYLGLLCITLPGLWFQNSWHTAYINKTVYCFSMTMCCVSDMIKFCPHWFSKFIQKLCVSI